MMDRGSRGTWQQKPRIRSENAMQSVEVKKESLLTLLRTNREKHIAEYKEAVVDYRKACRALLEKASKKIRDDQAPVITAGNFRVKDLSVHLSAPTHHRREYDLAIRMLEMSVDDTIKLTQ